MTLKQFIWASLIAIAATGCSEKQDGLKVMSFNVRTGKADDGENSWDIRKPAAIAMLDEINPDLVGLQEALPFQEEYLTEGCPRYKSFGVGRDDGVNGEKMTVLYNSERIEFMDGGTWWLSETPDVPSRGWDAKYPRTATWILAKDISNGRQFYFVNTHLDHRGAEARKRGLALVMDKCREMNPEIPMILMGDLNVEPGDPCLEDVEHNMVNARTAATVSEDTPSFNGFQEPKKVIDYIYFKGFSGASEFHVVTKEYEGKPFISDHYPIYTILSY